MAPKAKGLIEADFHIHSKFSCDSFLSPRQIIKTAMKKGLSAIAVTDHNNIKGARKEITEKLSEDEASLVIYVHNWELDPKFP